ncbi:hypothetical protein BBP40_003449 [Aspergillus hancockii]|nr:hypothetical protein BBP40_003449 [Aspergillus hancockii]
MEPVQRSPSPTIEETEATPLLVEEPEDDLPTREQHRPFNAKQARRLLFLICFSVVTIDFGAFLSIAPQIEIFESIICRKHYQEIGVFAADSLCKAPEVQGELAFLNGWMDTLDEVPGILLAIPYGLMADRLGRKPVLLLSLLGLILDQITLRLISWYSDIIPLRAILFAPLFLICGGGSQIATSMAYTMATDIVPSEERSSLFFKVAAVVLLAQVIAVPLSALLATSSPWCPYLLGLLCIVVGMSAALLASETRGFRQQPDEHVRNSATDRVHPVGTNHTKSQHLWARTWEAAKDYTATIRSNVNRNIVCVSLAFLMAGIGTQALQLVIQYASKRFSWSLSRASLLLTVNGIVNIFVFLVVFPQISQILVKRMSATEKDLRISRGTAWALTVGAALMALAAHSTLFMIGVCVFAVGCGFTSAFRSVATGLVAPSHVGVLNTTIAISQGIGSMMAGPLLAAAFRRGMALGGFWLGLPYMVAATLLFGVSCLTHGIRPLRKD